jgi:TonB family protein
MTKAVTDAAAMTSLFADSVTNGGLWFEDPACKALPIGELPKDKHAAFARCLVGLKLQPSAREDERGDVVVMTYEPGFELELRMPSETNGPRLTWIGFSGRRPEDKLPTISGAVLEASRLAGDHDGPLEGAVAAMLDAELQGSPERVALTWLRVCIDGEGAVTSADPYETTSLKAQTAFKAAALTWKFKPFMVGERAVAVCAMKRLSYPAGAAPLPETIPPPVPRSKQNKEALVFAPGPAAKLVEGRRIVGDKNVSPDEDTKNEIARSRNRRLEGRFRVCIDEQGNVESVLALRSTGYAAYDGRLIAAMEKWRYSPFLIDDKPVPVCTGVSFIYSQR